MDIRRSGVRPGRAPPGRSPPAHPPGGNPPSEVALPPRRSGKKNLGPLFASATGAALLLAVIVWYAIGLPGAPAGLRRALGRLPPLSVPEGAPSPAAPERVSSIAGLSCGESAKRRPIAVMLGSDPVARPISGFAEADLVFEVPVLTNNVTRLLAVYQCGHPREIGGVRSARHDYLFLAKGLDAVLAHWGGSYHALNRIRGERAAGGIPVYETIDAIIRTGQGAYSRAPHLPAPYNGYTTYERLWAALRENGYRTYSVFAGYPHAPDSPRAARAAGGTLDIGWPGAMRVRYSYDPETNAYARFWGGVPHLDRVDALPVRPKVLVVMHAEQRLARGPGGYNEVDLEGSGPAEIYQNGEVLQATWSKSEVHKQDPLLFTSALGNPVTFVPGQIWIHLVDGKTKVQWTTGPQVPPEPSPGETPRHLGG